MWTQERGKNSSEQIYVHQFTAYDIIFSTWIYKLPKCVIKGHYKQDFISQTVNNPSLNNTKIIKTMAAKDLTNTAVQGQIYD